MLHTNQAELNQLYDTYCRVWAAGGQATLTTTTSLEGKLTAKLEVELGKPTDARPGAPPPHLRTACSPRHEAPASGAVRRPCHRGPAAKAKSRARAAAYQPENAAAAAASAAQESESDSAPASPGSGGTPSTPASKASLEAHKTLNILPSPPASDGQRLVVSVGRGERLPSFSQLDGQDDPTLPPSPSGDSSFMLEEEDIPEVVCDYGVNAFYTAFSTPPAKVRYPLPGYGNGIGTFHSIHSDGRYCYDFGKDFLVKVFPYRYRPTQVT